MLVNVGKVSDIPEGGSIVAMANGKEVALFKIKGSVYAVDNTCPHQGGPLGEGSLDGAVVTCPWHAWMFDVTTGACQTTPDVTQPTYPVKIEGDQVFVEA